jgi:hypothetical protein
VSGIPAAALARTAAGASNPVLLSPPLKNADAQVCV